MNEGVKALCPIYEAVPANKSLRRPVQSLPEAKYGRRELSQDCHKPSVQGELIGGANRDRAGDLLNAIPVTISLRSPDQLTNITIYGER
jgi:hypothetical protein